MRKLLLYNFLCNIPLITVRTADSREKMRRNTLQYNFNYNDSIEVETGVVLQKSNKDILSYLR